MRRAAQVYYKSGLKEAFLGRMVVEEFGNFKRAVFDDPINAANWLNQQGFNASTHKPHEM